jgi:hypothetical protein
MCFPEGAAEMPDQYSAFYVSPEGVLDWSSSN